MNITTTMCITSIVHHSFTNVNTQPIGLHCLTILYIYITILLYIIASHNTVVAEQIVYSIDDKLVYIIDMLGIKHLHFGAG